MALKIFKGIWFLSMIAVLANLLYVYASLPELVSVLEDGLTTYSIGREPFFYSAMTVIALCNVLVYFFSKSVTPSEEFRTWLHGLVITLNIFFVIGLSFISLYNSAEKYDFSRIGFIIYSSVGLVAAWAISWPVYRFGRSFLTKPTV